MRRLYLLLFLIAGCGQSGPLYLPGDPSRMEVPPVQQQPREEQGNDNDSNDSEDQNR